MTVRDFLLPDLGEGLEDAEVVKWRVAEGDRVALNQPLVEVDTAKALVEIPSPWEGVVQKLHAGEGDVIKVGQPLVSIEVPGEAGSVPKKPARSADKAAPERAGGTTGDGKSKRRPVLVGYGVADTEEEAPPAGGARRARADRGEPVPASPPVRRLAKSLGIDLATVAGTGPGKRVTREDVLNASEEREPSGSPTKTERRAPVEEESVVRAGPSDRRVPVRGVRRLVAEKMARSAREIPHVTTFLTVDASQLEAFRAELEGEAGSRVTALPIVVRAFVDTLKRHPMVNASFDARATEILVRGEFNVGIATDTDRGLLVPVVRQADQIGILALAAEINRLVQAARTGRATPAELTGSTVTVSNVGTFGAEYGTPIINYPESAILAIGVIEPRALVVEGRVEARPAVTLSLSFDHRVMDGAQAGRALGDLGALLESPFRLGALPR